VPLPTAMDNHQYYNANAFEDVGGGWVMTQDGFTVDSLSARLEAFLTAPATLVKAAENAKKMGSPDATERLAALALSVGGGRMTDDEKKSSSSSVIRHPISTTEAA